MQYYYHQQADRCLRSGPQRSGPILVGWDPSTARVKAQANHPCYGEQASESFVLVGKQSSEKGSISRRAWPHARRRTRHGVRKIPRCPFFCPAFFLRGDLTFFVLDLVLGIAKDCIIVHLCLSVPGIFGESDVRWSHLLDEELLIAMPQTHRLAARRTLGMNELSSEPFLALSPVHTLRIIFDKVCADASFSPKIAFEGMDIGTLRGLIAAGLGIGLLPPAPVRVAGLVEIKLSQARPIRPLAIGWVEDRYLPPCAVEFRKFVVSKFKEE